MNAAIPTLIEAGEVLSIRNAILLGFSESSKKALGSYHVNRVRLFFIIRFCHIYQISRFR